MTLASVDVWIGRTLFLPPIIKFCQLTHQSQFAVSRLFWFFAALDGFYQSDSWFSSILFGVMSVIMMLTASLRADMPTYSSRGFRLLTVALLLLDVLMGVIGGDWRGIEFWVLVLIAEYAATIRTLPPKEEKRAAGRTAGAGSTS